MRDELVVYWAPANFLPENESWNQLYPDPENLYTSIIKKTKKDAPIKKCPALRDLNKNVFYFYSAVDDNIEIPPKFLEKTDVSVFQSEPLVLDSKVALKKARDSQYEGYADLEYNMTWVLFAEEPLIAKFTAPYFPAVTPAPGVMLASGKFDIGKWFRNWNLDYHIPLSTKKFEIKKNDPLFFVEFETDKKVVMKRFVMNSKIWNFFYESSKSTARYGLRMSLEERYQMFKQSRSREIVLKEIKNNLVD